MLAMLPQLSSWITGNGEKAGSTGKGNKGKGEIKGKGKARTSKPRGNDVFCVIVKCCAGS